MSLIGTITIGNSAEVSASIDGPALRVIGGQLDGQSVIRTTDRQLVGPVIDDDLIDLAGVEVSLQSVPGRVD